MSRFFSLSVAVTSAGLTLWGFGPTSAFAQTAATPDPISNLTVGRNILDTVSRQLPERRAVGAEFLNETYQPSISLNQDSHLAVTFVSEGAGYRNALGYFTYDTGAFDSLSFADIDTNRSGNVTAREIAAISGVTTTDIIFGNASGSGGFAGTGGSLSTGDTFVLGGGEISATPDGGWLMDGGTTFSAGTNVGFFVAANAWNGRGVNSWDNNRDVKTYWSLDFLNPENVSTATIADVSRDTRHVAMLNIVDENQILMGFEDQGRSWGDNDFNDAVFLVRSDPVDAMNDSPIPEVSAAPIPVAGAGAFPGLMLGGMVWWMRRRPDAKKA